MPGPVMRIAPKPRRRIVRGSVLAGAKVNVPDAAITGVLMALFNTWGPRGPPYTEPVSRSRLLLLAGAGVFGVFVFLIQLGVVVSVVQAGIAGIGLQSHLSGSADGLASGDYEVGLAEFELAKGSRIY